METMTWEEIERDWSGLQKRHRMDIAQAVARYCVGHRMTEVGKRLGYEEKWVRDQLDVAGTAAATGGSQVGTPLVGTSGNVGRNEIPRLIREFAPSVSLDITNDGEGNQSIAAITGDDAEAFEPYLQHYVDEGHTPSAAVRLAKAEWAAEEAVNAGVIEESVNKRNEKVNQILFPDEPKERWELDFRRHMAQVEQAVRFLDESKINRLRRKSTCERVASVHEKWLEQVERLLNLNPTLNKD
jgi:hypothetical protein